MILFILTSLALMSIEVIAHEKGNTEIKSFRSAKKKLKKIYGKKGVTFYCNCSYKNKEIDLTSCNVTTKKFKKRAKKLEWEHIVPAQNFGRSFPEWRIGSAKCTKKNKSYKGRKCARKNSLFRKMEADLYNLVPAVGAINAGRSNKNIDYVSGPLEYTFGTCPVKISKTKIEPPDRIKGIVARTYLYMDWAYPKQSILGNKTRKIVTTWSRKFPVTRDECQLYVKKREKQKNTNPYLEKPCKAFGHEKI
jgi:deoxyribonuclease-1